MVTLIGLTVIVPITLLMFLNPLNGKLEYCGACKMSEDEITPEDWNEFEIDCIALILMWDDNNLSYEDARKQAIIQWRESYSLE